MGDPIRTISLDDLGDLDASTTTQPYKSDAQDTFASDFGTNASSPISDSPFPSDLQTSPESALGTNAGETRLTEIFGRFGGMSQRRRLAIVSLVLAAVGGALVMLMGDVGTKLWEQLLGEQEAMQSSAARVAPPQTAVPVPAPQAPATDSQVDTQNPYWNLPNPLDLGPELAPKGVLTLAQEEHWRAGLEGSKNLRYDTYLKFHTVQDMRAKRFKGSEAVLNEALNQPKFWTRMEALMALAEIGQVPDVDTVQNAIGNTRASLVKNYFKRYRAHANAAETYILRQAIRVVDGGARQVILEALTRQHDEATPLYLYAASFDPSPEVVAWYGTAKKQLAFSEAQIESFKRYASGQDKPAPPRKASDPIVQAKPAAPPMHDLKVEELPHDVNVEEVYFLNEGESSGEEAEAVPVEEADDGFESLKKSEGKSPR